MKEEIRIFFTALMFFTRIPCPKWVGHEPGYLQKSSKYFPLVGILVGSIGAITFYLSHFIVSIPLAIISSVIATVYTTGAFHEDGFADVCDGFGGGWTKEKILLIMKDSRLGTYGTIGLVLLLGVKILALTEIPIHWIPITLISGHSSSRFIATTLIYTHPYVRDTDSKAKPAAQGMNTKMLLISGFFGVLPFIFFRNPLVFLCLLPMYLSKMYLGNKFTKWIGGQTGDCAGAVQQVSEVIFYLSILILWKFT
ncbi:adenosylcobinamide-GDP ribazoletransferase [Aquimarina sp. ERC-38]|uniref:adenosylcobinamide-GDP ribazoletransferase n=1 Tax=Aquimarina sp. ERC-38 TaxID=2949996 RepID=UPI002245EC87|nr:adenosylcobinamide-GDP ribazoletransferase [Aquimarina sp. ERC-38]UZO80776.1 adenosylcobinamide-GDP ribazoletransferase [Aquimarina sp. ERC-38]